MLRERLKKQQVFEKILFKLEKWLFFPVFSSFFCLIHSFQNPDEPNRFHPPLKNITCTFHNLAQCVSLHLDRSVVGYSQEFYIATSRRWLIFFFFLIPCGPSVAVSGLFVARRQCDKHICGGLQHRLLRAAGGRRRARDNRVLSHCSFHSANREFAQQVEAFFPPPSILLMLLQAGVRKKRHWNGLILWDNLLVPSLDC